MDAIDAALAYARQCIQRANDTGSSMRTTLNWYVRAQGALQAVRTVPMGRERWQEWKAVKAQLDDEYKNAISIATMPTAYDDEFGDEEW